MHESHIRSMSEFQTRGQCWKQTIDCLGCYELSVVKIQKSYIQGSRYPWLYLVSLKFNLEKGEIKPFIVNQPLRE